MTLMFIIHKHYTKMSSSFEIDNYAIVSSLNERTIYIKVMDTITFMCYESNVDSKELRISIELGDSYKLMNKCFQKEDGYNVNITVNSGIMKLMFSAVVEGYLRINFEIMLREKIMANDGQLTLNFNRIEQRQAQAIDVLTQRLTQLEGLIDAISYAEIDMILPTNRLPHYSCQPTWRINTTEMILNEGINWDFSKIKLFYQLEKLTIKGNSINNFQEISNKTIEQLTLHCIDSLNSFKGLNKLSQLKKITISGGGGSDFLEVLKSYKHKINDIIVNHCGAINNTELMTYCQKNNIKLELA